MVCLDESSSPLQASSLFAILVRAGAEHSAKAQLNSRWHTMLVQVVDGCSRTAGQDDLRTDALVMIQCSLLERLYQAASCIQRQCVSAGNDRVRRCAEAASCATLLYSFCVFEDEQRHARHHIHSILPPLYCEEERHASNSKHLGSCAQKIW